MLEDCVWRFYLLIVYFKINELITSYNWSNALQTVRPTEVLAYFLAKSRCTCRKPETSYIINRSFNYFHSLLPRLLSFLLLYDTKLTPRFGKKVCKKRITLKYNWSIPVVVTVLAHLPPRSGSVPWLAKSRPYILSPSRIFCLHWVLGASWRTQSLIQGRGELGPALLNKNKPIATQNIVSINTVHLLLHHWLSHLAPLE